MKIAQRYSHLNGQEYLMVHHPRLLTEVEEVIERIDAEVCKTKVSRESTMLGRRLFSPPAINRAFKQEFELRGWKRQRRPFWVTADEKLMRAIHHLPADLQKTEIENAGHEPIPSYNDTDFIKERVAVEVQFGKYAFVAHDLFVKHLSFFVADIIDVGIEILPMKEMEKEMSSGVPCYERDLVNVIRQGRGVPAVPLVLFGISP